MSHLFPCGKEWLECTTYEATGNEQLECMTAEFKFVALAIMTCHMHLDLFQSGKEIQKVAFLEGMRNIEHLLKRQLNHLHPLEMAEKCIPLTVVTMKTFCGPIHIPCRKTWKVPFNRL
jgi:hypothetical protein